MLLSPFLSFWRCEMSWQKVLLALTVAVCVSTPAFATILFSDNFEAGASGDPLGTAVVGAWALSGTTPENSLRLAWPTAGGGLPAVVSGTMYGATIRGKAAVDSATYSYADAQFASQGSASTLVRFEADIWGQNSGATAADLNLAFLSGGTALNSVQISGTSTGGVVSVGGVATGLTWGIGEWHHVTMDYRPSTSTFSLGIDAQTLTGLAMTAPSAVDAVRLVETSAGQDRWSVFDNVSISTVVPEPSSIMLLVSALMGLVAYAWKIRR
jgi:hypothetical protein